MRLAFEFLKTRREGFAVRVTLSLPSLNALAPSAAIAGIHVREGQALAPGAKLLDVRVDLSEVADHDCPPVSDYSIFLREPLVVRRVLVRQGEEAKTGALLVVLSKAPADALDDGSERPARVSVAGMLSEPDWWGEREP